MLAKGAVVTHPELDGLEIKCSGKGTCKPLTAEQLVKLDQEKQGIEQQKVEKKVFEIMNARIAAMEVHLQENPDPKKRKDLTRVKGRFFERVVRIWNCAPWLMYLGWWGKWKCRFLGLMRTIRSSFSTKSWCGI